MPTVVSFKDLLVWQKAHSLILEVYRLTEQFPKNEVFCLTNQIRRCGISIPSNIVEGFKRRTKADSLHFYNIAEGSLEELKYQLLLARDLEYISSTEHEAVSALADEVGKMLTGWKKAQK